MCCMDSLLNIVITCEQQNPCSQFLLSHLMSDLLSIHLRQVDIQNSNIRIQITDQFKRMFSISSLPNHAKTILQSEGIGNALPEQWMIVND